MLIPKVGDFVKLKQYAWKEYLLDCELDPKLTQKNEGYLYVCDSMLGPIITGLPQGGFFSKDELVLVENKNRKGKHINGNKQRKTP